MNEDKIEALVDRKYFLESTVNKLLHKKLFRLKNIF